MPGLRGVCGLVTIKKQLRLLVAAADGYLYVYNVDTNEGGDCNLIKQHRSAVGSLAVFRECLWVESGPEEFVN